jgi:kanamycin kinase/aminoglycoside 3'-phosphotransferase-3
MYIPEVIKKITQYKKPIKDDMGMSGSHVYMYEDYVLKIHELETSPLHKERDVMLWLKPYIPVPGVLYYHETKSHAYLLMTKLDGVMTCDQSVLDQPYQMVSLLAKGLKMLWSIPIDSCPFDATLKNKLKICKHNIDIGDVDVSQAEDDTYTKDGFKDPLDLYNYLVSHQVDEELVFTHSDYCLPNVLVKDNRVVGFIDFDRAGIACKWADIALCIRSIYHNFGHHEDYINHLFKELNLEPKWDKIKYYILLDELL